MVRKYNDLNLNDFVITLLSSGKNKNPDEYNTLQEYLTQFKEKPSTFSIRYEDNDIYHYENLKRDLKQEFKNSTILFQDIRHDLKINKTLTRREIVQLEQGYIIEFIIDIAQNSFKHPKKDIGLDKYTHLIEYNLCLIPNQDSEYYNPNIIDTLIKIFKRNSIQFKKQRVSIGLVSVDDNGELYVDNFYLDDKIDTMVFPDEHYGEGFEDFYLKLLSKLKSETKGLVLLHGEPGTGKTFFVRQLLKELTKSDKNILYFSPVMVDSITDPTFINFISNWAIKNDKKGIILIEDAEPLLESRDTVRNNGVTNILNMTDGLLNDVLGIQIICTFNTPLSNIDSALLREERLIARKEFKKLNYEQAVNLANKLGIPLDGIKDDMTLAQIYALKGDNSIILHDVADKKKKIGFGNKL